MPSPAQTLGAKLAAKQKALADLYAAHKTTDAERPYNFTAEQVEQVKTLNTELDALGKEWEEAREIEAIEAKNAKLGEELARPVRPPFQSGTENGAKAGRRVLSLGEHFAKNFYRTDRDGAIERENGRAVARKGEEIEAKDWDLAEFKTTMTTAAGFGPENLRSGRVQLSAQRPIKVPDILPTINLTTGNAYVFMSETTFTNNAAEAAENAAAAWGEGALVYTEQSANIRKVATFLPVTDEQLSDVPGMQDLINSRLSYMLMLRLDSQLLNGDGIAPNINGFYAQVTQAQAKGADPVFDAVYKGMIKVMHTGFGDPTANVFHPNDWQDLRLTRTTDGIYIMGNPADPGPDRLFGVPVVVTPAALENTVLTGDFAAHSALVYRTGIELKVSDSHSDLFVKGVQAVRATIRAALVVFRPNAFCEVTGM